MVTCVMGVIVAGMGTIYTSITTTKIFSDVARGKVAGIFRPRYTSVIINSYITPQVTIIVTYISPPVTIITTGITLLISMTNI